VVLLGGLRGVGGPLSADYYHLAFLPRARARARAAGVTIAGLCCAAHPGGMELLGPVPVL